MESVCSFVARFQATFFFLVLPVLRGHFFARHAVSRAFPIVRVWSGTEENSLLGVFFSPISVWVPGFVMFCVNIISDGLQCVFVLLVVVLIFCSVYGFGHCCTSKEGIKIRLCCALPHMCYVVDGCCVGTDSVFTTLVS